MLMCPSCGQANPDGFRMCGMCGASLSAPREARVERKVVTVQFCKELVGEGGYEGLSMFSFQTGLLGEAFEGGVIVPSDGVPAFPELPAESPVASPQSSI